MPRIWLIGMAAAASVVAFAPGAASAQAAPSEGRSVRAAPLPYFLRHGCWITTDRVRNERFWDPSCSEQGAGIRPGPGD